MKDNQKSEYEISVNMRISESQIQWERFNAMLVINTILIGFIGFTYSTEFKIPIFIQLFLSPMGIVLSLLWMRMTNRGFMWTKFWTDEARIIEEKNKEQIIKPFKEGKIHKETNEVLVNTQLASKIIIYMFIVFYLLFFINKLFPYIATQFTKQEFNIIYIYRTL